MRPQVTFMKKLRLLPYVFPGEFPSIAVSISQISDREIVVFSLQAWTPPHLGWGNSESNDEKV
jgi:hypothetical protein